MKVNIKFLFITTFTIILLACNKEDSKTHPDTRPKDADGNIYDTVVIGTQTWMLQNLKTTKYNDGTPITTNLSNTDWTTTVAGAFAVYSGTYGCLYNWYSVNSGKLAPKGWHIPTKNEWDILITYLGGDAVAGASLKDTSALWLAPNTGATNSSRFSALPGGSRTYYDGSFVNAGIDGKFWSNTESISNTAWGFTLNKNNTNASSGQFYKEIGFSVRCIRD